MGKPSLFRVRDFLIGLIPAIFLIFLAGYVQSTDNILEAKALMWVLAGSFSAGYAFMLNKRKKFLDRITFVTKHQMYIITNGFNYTKEQIEEEVDNLIIKWSAITEWDKTSESLEGLYVYFDNEVNYFNLKLAGYYIGDVIHVKYHELLERTAFSHEVGHRIYHYWKGNKNQSEHHEFMKEHKLG